VTAARAEAFLGMLMLPDTAVVLARLDPLSLEPVSEQVAIGEYHDAWSVSPDSSRVAVGVSAPGRRARVGILIVDLEAMKVVRKIETGIAAEVVAWLAPHLLVAGLQRGGTVLIDPSTGKILHRWPRLSDPQSSARTQDGLVMLLPGPIPATPEGTAAARLAVVDPRGRLRSVTLERIQLALRDGVQWDGGGLAVDTARDRAYVFAAEAPAAEVDLGTMRVSYYRLESLFVSAGELGGSEVPSNDALIWRSRRALWLGDGHVLVLGHDGFEAPGGEDFVTIAAGATLVDTATWRSCVLDARGGGAAFVAGRVFMYGRGDPTSRGLRAYTVAGREAFHLFSGEQVLDLQAAADLAYARTRSAVHVVDARSGEVVSKVVPPADLVDVIAEPQ
jgi:hypothetical protein